jgi:uncharacterized membrane protein YfcA
VSDAILHIALAGAGIGAGFINTIAGGGSMLTLPALMLLGLPANLANGTNRLSIISQSVSGAWAFHRSGRLDTSGIARVVVPTVVGSAIGAAVASQVPEAILKYVLLGTMMTMALVLAVHPRAVTAPEGSEPRFAERRLAAFGGLFVAGLYAGFVQAGVGFVLLSVLGGIIGYDVVRANALKLVCTLIFGIVATGVFVAADQVVWDFGLLLAGYTVIGSQLGVRFALKVRQDVIRWIIFVAVVATCVAALVKG